MKNELFKKGWAVGLMVLFIVGGLTSNIGADDIRPTNTRGIVYVDDDAICPGHGTEAAPYCRIRYAIENTSSSDTIMVASGTYNENSGTYNENIVIDKELTIDWYGGDINGTDTGIPIIDGSNTGCVIEIRASHVNIKRMHITNSGDTGRDAGIYIEDYNKDVTINNCEISDCHFGIWIFRTSVAGKDTVHTIQLNNIHHIQRQGILISFSDGNIISDNTVTDCGLHGIHLLDCEQNSITGNTLEDNRNGIVIDVGRENEISGNTCQSNDNYGFLISSDIKSRITGNNFMGNGEEGGTQAYWEHYNFIQSTIWNGNWWGRPAGLIKIIWGTVLRNIPIPWFTIEPFPANSQIV